jgi:type I restriction enzyme M protein
MKKSLGNKRNLIGDGEEGRPPHIAEITSIYGEFKDNETRIFKIDGQDKTVSTGKIFDNQNFGYLKITVERPLRLNFAVDDERLEKFMKSSYFVDWAVSKKRKDKHAIEDEIVVGQQAQQAVLTVLNAMKKDFTNGKPVKDRAEFEKQLKTAFKDSAVILDNNLKKALLSPGCLAEKDPAAACCVDNKGNPEPDPDLRDTENVDFPAGIELPLPLAYEPPRPLHEIEEDIKGLEKEIMEMLKVVV